MGAFLAEDFAGGPIDTPTRLRKRDGLFRLTHSQRVVVQDDAMKLNLGCGRTIIDGWLNVDNRGGDIICDAASLPFKNHSFDNILASHVLEHVLDLWNVLHEMHRVLRPRGILKVRVPYGIKGFLITPYHVRAFTLKSFDNISDVVGGKSLERVRLFRSLDRSLNYAIPFKWHIHKYLGFMKLTRETMDGRIETKLPLGPAYDITFILEKIEA